MNSLVIFYNEEVENNGDDSVLVPRPLASVPNHTGPVDGRKILDAFAQQNAKFLSAKGYERRRLSIVIIPEIPLPVS